jgi:S-adenosylmethionine:tRNA ribosyltransferase-isomerase
MKIPQVQMGDFDYDLPESQIRKRPLEIRSQSRLVVKDKNQIYFHDAFENLSKYLNRGDLLVGNASKVVPARIFFQKESGAVIEILCLSPNDMPYAEAFSQTSSVVFTAYIGNSKKWKSGTIACTIGDLTITAERKGSTKDAFIIEFSWNKCIPFSQVLEACGKVPIPPYFEREEELIDRSRYQTVFAKWEGSVAAPTAGLHYDDLVLQRLKNAGVDFKYLTLHVGAGTFKPVTTDEISGHEMHNESFEISKVLIEELLAVKGKRIAAGTTSMRALESLYWLAFLLKSGDRSFFVPQWLPYQQELEWSGNEALHYLIQFMNENQLSKLSAKTEICIVPGYQFRIVQVLQTNFHQPKSTLLLLIAAILGDEWKELYKYALKEDLAFLSYGDTMLLDIK